MAARISRRRFLHLSLGAGAWAVGCASAPDEPEARALPGVVDAHVHMWSRSPTLYPRRERFAGVTMKPRRYEPADFLAMAALNGVEKAVLVQSGMYGTDHRYLLSVLEAHPDRFVGVGAVEEGDEPAAVGALADMGLRGVHLPMPRWASSWPDREEVIALWRAAGERELPMCVLPVPDQLPVIGEMAELAPSTPVVVEHMGRVRPRPVEQSPDLEALAALARYPQVYVKLSGLHMLGDRAQGYADLVPMVRRLIEAFGAERLMWGSDAPYQMRNENRYQASLGLMRSISGISEEQREQILRRTALRVFFRGRTPAT